MPGVLSPVPSQRLDSLKKSLCRLAMVPQVSSALVLRSFKNPLEKGKMLGDSVFKTLREICFLWIFNFSASSLFYVFHFAQ